VLLHYYKYIPIYLILIISVYHIFDFQFEYSFALSLHTTIPVQNEQSKNELSMMNSNSSSDIRINKNQLSSILPSSILPLPPNFFPFSSMLNFSNIEEKIMIQHNPEVDNFILDSDPPIFSSQVLQPLGSECDRCFASESIGGTLPPDRVVELEAYLADPANTVPIGADPDVNSIAELCAAIVAAAAGMDPVLEQDIRDLLVDALKNPPPGQVQQVIDCLLLAGLITETQQELVVETSIDSAIDGNGDPVANLSSTTSNDINFTFSGHVTPEGTDDISRGFVCVLDGETFDCTDDTGESFTSSEEFLNLPPGTHSFTVRAFVQVSEEVRIEDQTPETFTWTIEEEEEEPPEEPEEPEEPEDNDNPPADDNPPTDDNNNQPSNNNPSQVPNEAGGEPQTGITPFGDGPTGAAPFSPITPAGIDPSIPRDITIYQEPYKNPPDKCKVWYTSRKPMYVAIG